MGPTLAGFLLFIRNTMGISTTYLPDSSQWITWAFNYAMKVVNPLLAAEFPCPPCDGVDQSWSIYALAVYNLGGDRLINYAPDQPNQTYFKTLRGPIADGGFGITNFVAGVVQAAADEATSDSLLVPDFFKTLTLSNLQNLKTPYGIEYLSLAQDWGPTVWGLS